MRWQLKSPDENYSQPAPQFRLLLAIEKSLVK